MISYLELESHSICIFVFSEFLCGEKKDSFYAKFMFKNLAAMCVCGIVALKKVNRFGWGFFISKQLHLF